MRGVALVGLGLVCNGLGDHESVIGQAKASVGVMVATTTGVQAMEPTYPFITWCLYREHGEPDMWLIEYDNQNGDCVTASYMLIIPL